MPPFCQRIGLSDENAKDEDLSDKILYYIPSDTSLSEQVRDANIVEALIEFTNSFEEGAVVQAVNTQQHSQEASFSRHA